MWILSDSRVPFTIFIPYGFHVDPIYVSVMSSIWGGRYSVANYIKKLTHLDMKLPHVSRMGVMFMLSGINVTGQWHNSFAILTPIYNQKLSQALV
jgi:hypothetical protein